MRYITVLAAMERYDRPRAGVLSIVMLFRDMHGKGAAPLSTSKNENGQRRTIGFMLTPELDSELRRKKGPK